MATKRRQRIREPRAGALQAKVARLRGALRQARLRIKELSEEGEWLWRHARVSSPLTRVSHHLVRPSQSGWAWRWFETFCPCCKKPLDVTMLRVQNGDTETQEEVACKATAINDACLREQYGGAKEEKLALLPTPAKAQVAAAAKSEALTAVGSGKQQAMAVVMWGANPGFVLGALVLGWRLRELSTTAELILLHTDEVPQNHLDLLANYWQLRVVDYIDGARGLYTSKGHRFDGVFTKINAWNVTDFRKVLLLDIDIIPMHSLDSLFDLPTPAAFHRGRDDFQHGAPVNGRSFFIGEDEKDWSWCQGGGINAGVILLEPSVYIFRQMLHEVTCDVHPERVPGSGPEQDYFSRFFASAPWYHIGVTYNFQLHHLSFALERCLEWRNYQASLESGDGGTGLDSGDSGESSARLAMPLEDVRNVHFSGEHKLWERSLAEPGSTTAELSDAAFAERVLTGNIEGYERWFTRSSPAVEYTEKGCQLLPGGRIALLADGSEVTDFVDRTVERLRQVTTLATKAWRECAERLERHKPGLLECVRKIVLPAGSPWPLGAHLEGLWMDSWHPCVALGVHADGAYIVRFGEPGSVASIVERRVGLERLRLPITSDSSSGAGLAAPLSVGAVSSEVESQ